MRLSLPGIAVTAGLLATSRALSPQEIPADQPVSSLLSSAQSHLARGETSEALMYYDAAIARDPKNYLTLFKRATTYLSLGRSNQATDDFHQVLTIKPDFEGAHLQLAKILAKSADWSAARSEYVAANKDAESPELVELDKAEAAADLAKAAVDAGQWEDCIEQAGAAILIASRSTPLRELRSKCRFQRGEIEEGLGDLHHVLQMRPGDTSPHVVIAATSFYALGDLDSGLAQVRKCLHSDPDSKICKKLHKQAKAIQKGFTRTQNQLNKGQMTSAGRTLAGSQDDVGLISNVQDQAKEWQESGSIPSLAKIGLYENLIDMTCQAYSESTHKDAAKYCEEALGLNPESFWGLLFRAKKLLKEEEFEASIQALEKAAEDHPDKRDKVNPILKKAQIALKRSKTKDYYKVLGVASDADERQIKSAYRKASKVHHPDKAAKSGISKDEAEKKMASINEAYEVLSDPELRARFDRGDDPNSQERGDPFQGSPFGGGQHFMFQQGGGQNFKFHFGGGGPFGF